MYVWLLGASVALLGGGLAAWAFLALSNKLIGLGDKPSSGVKRVPPWLTGAVERAFFFLLVVLGVQGIPTAMVGWLALKLATNWNHPHWKDKPEARTRGLLALLAGLVSLAFAYIGGIISLCQLRVGT